ncbi:G-protein coupled receptor moody isoform X1 [Bicyclus anynana]|uniref:G-protein coupled receptor moody isoform X1 n=1 Tax=Bicyclus anynana TaxID=110368 RepID=A0A6J1NQZ9_BICAN|nr:G-protein coupled receptor moody isoform X1 [Bicyclus anynana]XP_052742014.1 G-protein coupled receptor moody isoform X1 [Bicyclus anynana]
MANQCAALVNVTLDTRTFISNDEYASVELYQGYSDGLLMFASVCFMISMAIGIPGNLLTIVALAKYKKVHNATAVFIMNLSCTDLLLLCLDPPLAASAYWRRSWTLGRVACQMYALGKCLLISASVFTILAITINRYILIIHPRLYRKMYRGRNLIIMLAAIWISPLIALIPTYLGKWGCFDIDTNDGPCSIVYVQNKRSSKKTLFILVLGLPCAVIIFCYARIFFIARKTTKKSQNSQSKNINSTIETTKRITSSINATSAVISMKCEEKRKHIPVEFSSYSEYYEDSSLEAQGRTDSNTDKDKGIPWKRPRVKGNLLQRSVKFFNLKSPTRKDRRLGTMIIAIMISFCVCNLPTVLTVTISGITSEPVLNIIAHVLLCFSCCFNPVIYVVMSNEYRKAYNNLFKH